MMAALSKISIKCLGNLKSFLVQSNSATATKIQVPFGKAFTVEPTWRLYWKFSPCWWGFTRIKGLVNQLLVLFLPVEAAYEAKRLGSMTARQNATLKMHKCVMQLFRKLPHMSKLARFVRFFDFWGNDCLTFFRDPEKPCIVLDATLPRKWIRSVRTT